MVEIGIVPTIRGYAAVGLRKTLGKTDKLVIHSPFAVTEDLKTRILGRLSREVAEYLWKVGQWEDIGFATMLWAIIEVIVLYVCLKTLLDYDIKFVLLYGWVRLWFLSSGLSLFLPYLAKFLHRRRAKKIRRFFRGSYDVVLRVEDRGFKLPLDVEDEEEFIAEMMRAHPELAGYYKQILEIDPPEIVDLYPLTVLKTLKKWILGAPIRLPRIVYHIGIEG